MIPVDVTRKILDAGLQQGGIYLSCTLKNVKPSHWSWMTARLKRRSGGDHPICEIWFVC